jgi:hypothetical protein
VLPNILREKTHVRDIASLLVLLGRIIVDVIQSQVPHDYLVTTSS